MKIIIDAMGGDNAPLEIVKGALSAHSRFGCDIVLSGSGGSFGGVAAKFDDGFFNRSTSFTYRLAVS